MGLTKKEKSELKLGQSIRFEVFDNSVKILSGRGKVINKIDELPGADGGRLFLIGQYTGDKKVYELSVDYFGEDNVVINRTKFPKELSTKLDNYVQKYFKEKIQTESVISDYRNSRSKPKKDSKKEMGKKLYETKINIEKLLDNIEVQVTDNKVSKYGNSWQKNVFKSIRKMRYEIDYDIDKNYINILFEPDDSVDTSNFLESDYMWKKLGKGSQFGKESKEEQKDSVLKVFKELGFNYPGDKVVNKRVSQLVQVTSKYQFMTDGRYMMPTLVLLIRPKKELTNREYKELILAILNVR